MNNSTTPERGKEEITADVFVKLGFVRQDGLDYKRKFGTVLMGLRLNAGKCYCEVGEIYIGEIETIERLNSLLFGLTGREEFKISNTNE